MTPKRAPSAEALPPEETSAIEHLRRPLGLSMRANCLLMLLRVSSAVALLPVARRAGVKSLPVIARRGKVTASLLTAPQSPASVLFPRLVRRSMTVRACTAAELSPEDAAAVAAVDAQAKEISRLKGDEGLGNKDPQVEAAVAELLRLKALLPESLQGPKRRTKEEKKAQKEQEQKAQSAGEGRTSAAVTQVKSDGKQQAMDLNPPRGTRDFYPEDMALRSWLFGQWRETARLYGFEEYDAPVLESEELYVRKVRSGAVVASK